MRNVNAPHPEYISSQNHGARPRNPTWALRWSSECTSPLLRSRFRVAGRQIPARAEKIMSSKVGASFVQRFIPALFLLLLMSLAAAAQTASINGTVTDASGALLQNAKVTVINCDQRHTQHRHRKWRSLSTTELVPGRYDVRIEKTGFNTAKFTGLKLTVDQCQKGLSFGAQPCCPEGSSRSDAEVTLAPWE
jgi:hypothetical protein